MFNNLQQWLEYLETLHPKAIELGLGRIRQVAEKLNLCQQAAKVITVAGSNGKGSCIAAMEAILSAEGYRVGSYTSPHLFKFNERIKVNKQAITDQTLCQLFTTIEQVRGNIRLTYFEFTTLAALLHFKQSDLDIILLEIGLGGRLDAVNIIDADISIISSISLEHTEWLGDSLEKIAIEKSGVMRAGRPIIYGGSKVVATIAEQAIKKSAILYLFQRDFNCDVKNNEISWWSHQQTIATLPKTQVVLSNIACVLQALELLPLAVSNTAIVTGLTQLMLPGRMQVIDGDVKQIFDVAHNPASIAALAAHISQQYCPGRCIAVFSMLADKKLAESIAAIKHLIDEWYVSELNCPRTVKLSALHTALFKNNNLQCITKPSITAAYQAAMAAAVNGDKVIVFGSFYTVAEVLMNISSDLQTSKMSHMQQGDAQSASDLV